MLPLEKIRILLRSEIPDDIMKGITLKEWKNSRGQGYLISRGSKVAVIEKFYSNFTVQIWDTNDELAKVITYNSPYVSETVAKLVPVFKYESTEIPLTLNRCPHSDPQDDCSPRLQTNPLVE